MLRQFQPFMRFYHEEASIIGSTPNSSSPIYQENYAQMKILVDQLKSTVEKIVEGGGQKARDRHSFHNWQVISCMIRRKFQQVGLSLALEE